MAQMTNASSDILTRIEGDLNEAHFFVGEAMGLGKTDNVAVAEKLLKINKKLEASKRWIARFLFINNLTTMSFDNRVNVDMNSAHSFVPRNPVPSTAKESAQAFMAKLYPQHRDGCNYVMFALECTCDHDKRVSEELTNTRLKDAIDGVELEEDALEVMQRKHPELSFFKSTPLSTFRPEEITCITKPGHVFGDPPVGTTPKEEKKDNEQHEEDW